jgi:hypothetical protein
VCPSNLHPNARRGRHGNASRSALLSAACGLIFALAATAKGATEPLREKDVRRAEDVVAKLRLLDAAATATTVATGDTSSTSGTSGTNDMSEPRALRALVGRLYPGLFITVADMGESGLKTDLDTAAFLYERASRTWSAAGASTADCRRERRDIYMPLCLELRGGTTRELLLAKARLHARWAAAAVDDFRGVRANGTAQFLSAVKAARENDFVIAAQAVEALKRFREFVADTRKNAGSGERRAGTRPASTDERDALDSAGDLIAALPRSPAFYHLSNAWASYKDGLFWEQKVSQSRSLVVSANGFAGNPLKDIGVDAGVAAQTVASSFRQATRYTLLAEQSLRGHDELGSR